MALGVAGPRIEEVRLVTMGSRVGVQLRISGSLPRVTVRREGDEVRVSLEDAVLGGPFSGGDRFEWAPARAESPFPSGSASVGSLGIEKNPGGVSLSFRLPVETTIEVRREPSAVTLVLHEPVAPALSSVAGAPQVPPSPLPVPPARPAAALAPVATTKTPEPAAAVPEAPSPPAPVTAGSVPAGPTVILATNGQEAPTETPALAERAPAPATPPTLRTQAEAELLRVLFPTAPPPATAPPQIPPQTPPSAAPDQTRVASADELYGKLFPFATPETQEAPAVNDEAKAAPPRPRTLTVGFLTLRPSLRLSYIEGATTLESAEAVNADYFQIQPGLDLETTVWDGRLTLGYAPYIRAFSSYDVLEQTTHRGGARLDLPLGTRFTLKATDTFVSGVLETEEADPGHEYFFGLSRFRRNTVGVHGSLAVAPRLSIEAEGVSSAVRFDQPVGFFSYDSHSALLGLGYELTPKLRATLGYVYDRVPPPETRPLVEATAHSGQATLSGEITPLLAGELTLGYRDQTSPRAPESGRRFQGLTAVGSLTRDLGTASWLKLSVSRATPVSNFESNAFYVSTYADASLVLPLPFALLLDSGIGHRWNGYRTDTRDLGLPRDDKIFGWRVGLRRVFGGVASLAVGYRRDVRRSNLDRFDATTDGLILQLDLNSVGAGGYR